MKRSQFVVEAKAKDDDTPRRVWFRGTTKVVGIIVERDGKGCGYWIKKPGMHHFFKERFNSMSKAVVYLGTKL